MKTLFLRFVDSWTPFFLQKHSHKLTTGHSIGYYFFWSFIIGIGAVMLGFWSFRHWTTSEKILPLMDKVPAFEFQFVDNELVSTGLPEDPYVKTFEDQFHITISSEMVGLPAEPKEGVYILRDGFYMVQNKGFGNKIEGGTYEKMKVGTITLNNDVLKQKSQEFYPQFREALGTMVIIMLIFGWIFLTLFHLVLSFFWALIVWLVSMINGCRHLSYEESLRFVWHVFTPVLVAGVIFTIMVTYIPFLMTILFVLAFLYNHSFGGQEE